MRVVGGRLRGLKLAELGAGDAAAHLRPTGDRVRESIFNLLENSRAGNPVPGARVLDLFAGTGAMGIEALSRGAARVAFVDDGATSRALVRRNIDLARAQGATDVWRRDATRLGTNRGAPYSVVFLDPPYGRAMGEAALQSALAGGWIARGAVVVWEESGPVNLPAPLIPVDQRRYGESMVTIARMPDQAGAGQEGGRQAGG